MYTGNLMQFSKEWYPHHALSIAESLRVASCCNAPNKNTLWKSRAVMHCHAVCGEPRKPTVRTNSVQPKFWFTCKDRPKRLRASFMAASWRWLSFNAYMTLTALREQHLCVSKPWHHQICSEPRWHLLCLMSQAGVAIQVLFFLVSVSHGCICSRPSLLPGPQLQDGGWKKHSRKKGSAQLTSPNTTHRPAACQHSPHQWNQRLLRWGDWCVRFVHDMMQVLNEAIRSTLVAR